MKRDKRQPIATNNLREEHRARWKSEIATLVESVGGAFIPGVAISSVRATAPSSSELLTALDAEGYSGRAVECVLLDGSIRYEIDLEPAQDRR